ncbi:hypothetical protein Bdiaspc4_34565 [Bradyrhizobium diazoefficiens]|nr:hypothetical protein Bdiaspc4_34565 [Bradyrhizobium diazoefficiens]
MSLRAKRSNPESHRGGGLDCFASLAMTEDISVLRIARVPFSIGRGRCDNRCRGRRHPCPCRCQSRCRYLA